MMIGLVVYSSIAVWNPLAINSIKDRCHEDISG